MQNSIELCMFEFKAYCNDLFKINKICLIGTMCSLNDSNRLLCFYRSSENKRSAKPKYNTDSRLSKSEFGKILSLAKKSKGGTIWFFSGVPKHRRMRKRQ